MESTVVVGYDGSPAAERALVEAAHHAVSRGLPLTIVHALARDGSGAPAPASRGFGESRRRAAEQLLADGADLARYRHPDVVVRTLAVDGPAPATLAQAARGAALLVVGCRGLGRWEGLLLGSVSARVLAEADCPVLVVHDREPVPPGGVLAAVDVGVRGRSPRLRLR